MDPTPLLLFMLAAVTALGPAQCQTDFSCNVAREVCVSSYCQLISCLSSNECLLYNSTSYCDTAASKCKPMLAIGTSCSTSDQCICQNGKCVGLFEPYSSFSDDSKYFRHESYDVLHYRWHLWSGCPCALSSFGMA